MSRRRRRCDDDAEPDAGERGDRRGRHDRHARRARRHMRWHQSRWAWLLHARMRWRVFVWFGLVMALAIGARYWVLRAGGGRWSVVATLAAVWIASGMIAWRLTRPLLAVIEAARKIGDGDLTTRIETRHGGEIRELARAINDMASRIERQLNDQRELLAAVSHELRTPLGHMRILIETERERGADSPRLTELEAEIARLDDLVGR